MFCTYYNMFAEKSQGDDCDWIRAGGMIFVSCF